MKTKQRDIKNKLMSYTYIPPQTKGERNDSKFVPKKLKSCESKSFCKYVRNLIICRNMLNRKLPGKNFVPHIMNIQLYMLCS
ncbi:hypothetical protein Sjap_010299 [Stephania japonica]|uniref:Uncharacterized protein n=1 Tax=Stephania japonica TaxID=461633 RepID=A0AAP0JBC7_9MAGN